jgi:hypothetical protein
MYLYGVGRRKKGRERENKIVIGGLSEGTIGRQERKRE